MLATCASGFEPYLDAELRTLGVTHSLIAGGGIRFDASFHTAMKLCLWSRIANKIELLLGECYAPHEDAIYDL